MVKIRLWNTQHSKENLQTLLEVATEEVLAIQEPWINKQAGFTTYCPKKCRFYLIHEPESRAALYINKEIALKNWDYKKGKDWALLILKGTPLGLKKDLRVLSIYNPKEKSPLLIDLFREIIPNTLDNNYILAGDFNLHHPLWDIANRNSEDAEALIGLTNEAGLTLRTPRGLITRAPQGDQIGRPSTIDHFWVSENIPTILEGEDIRHKSDNFPTILTIQSIDKPRKNIEKRYNWKNIDYIRVEAETNTLITDLKEYLQPKKLESPIGLTEAFRALINRLQDIAKIGVPIIKDPPLNRNRPIAPWWTQEVNRAIKEAKKAERAYKKQPNFSRLEELREARALKTRAIREAQRTSWRQLLDRASLDHKILWQTSKWARLRSWAPIEDPKLPALIEGDFIAETHKDKANLLTKRFYPKPIVKDNPIKYREGPRIFSSIEVIREDIGLSLRKTRPWKAPGLDNLPVGFLKACGTPLDEILAILATASFKIGFFL